MRTTRIAAALTLTALLAATTACGKDDAGKDSSSTAGPGTTGSMTFALQGEESPTSDTFEGLEMKGTLRFEVAGSTVCPLVEEGGKKVALVVPKDWRFATGPDRIVDAAGNDVLKAGDDVSKVVFSPAYEEKKSSPCGGASDTAAVDGVSPKEG